MRSPNAADEWRKWGLLFAKLAFRRAMPPSADPVRNWFSRVLDAFASLVQKEGVSKTNIDQGIVVFFLFRFEFPSKDH